VRSRNNNECFPVHGGSACVGTPAATPSACAFAFSRLQAKVLQGLKLCFNRRDIGINQIVQQAGLLRIHLFATLGKLQAL